MSHIEMTKHTGILSNILSPFFVTNRKMNQKKGGKEKKLWTRVKDNAWGVQNEWENEAQTKDKNI